ncbi:cell wall hydrolase [Afifella sp. IM 167]|uniref:cell wall hydrolase n=1 Tax=Afifella sp. IM 167 TaxID=2033586 RepID=UPI001CCC56D7|nr:cell wall hydrolase [Afifella sp. IM 167]MBZ8133435.1 hypothetical protein [Afifella sp. IM 167]
MYNTVRARRGGALALALAILAVGVGGTAHAGPRASSALVELPRPKPAERASSVMAGKAKAGAPAAARTPRRCLAKALYFEARGETAKGQIAVGRVILNRVKDERYPDTICGVVFQNAKKRNRCQFSFACDGKADKVADPKLWREIVQRADWLLSCRSECADTPIWRGALWRSTHYHANYVSPGWAKRMRPTGEVGLHRFFYEARA